MGGAGERGIFTCPDKLLTSLESGFCPTSGEGTGVMTETDQETDVREDASIIRENEEVFKKTCSLRSHNCRPYLLLASVSLISSILSEKMYVSQ